MPHLRPLPLVTSLLLAACAGGASAPGGTPAPSEGAPLPLNRTMTATLDEGAPTWGQGGRFALWHFRASDGDRLEIVMRSQDFDALLTVGSRDAGIFDALDNDDDGAGDTDARLRFVAPRTGTFYVLAQALDPEATGNYTLTLRQLPPPPPLVAHPIAMGSTVRGELGPDDAVLEEDDSPYDAWTFDAHEGDRVMATLRSDAFDAYLHLVRWNGGEWESVSTDDDGAGGTDSRVVATIDRDGTWALLANAFGATAAGEYSLSLEALPEPGPAQVTPIRPGGTASGTIALTDAALDDGSYYDLYSFRAEPGRGYTITLRSDDFDAYLAVGTMEGGEMQAIETDDDGAGGTDARVTLAPDAAVDVVVQVNTLSAGETGAYTLEVEPE